jgi:hypothetical protein
MKLSKVLVRRKCLWANPLAVGQDLVVEYMSHRLLKADLYLILQHQQSSVHNSPSWSGRKGGKMVAQGLNKERPGSQELILNLLVEWTSLDLLCWYWGRWGLTQFGALD